MNNIKIDKAKAYLKSVGYYTDKLWSVYDVKDKFNCSESEAQIILGKSLNSELTMEQIWFSINFFGIESGLEIIK